MPSESKVYSERENFCTLDELWQLEHPNGEYNLSGETPKHLPELRTMGSSGRRLSENSDEREARNMVCAIDFGTTYTGVAYGYSDNPTHVKVPTLWSNRNFFPGFKTCTSVLTGKEGEFVAFGVEAEYLYSIKCNTGEYDDVELYRNFKMRLYKEKVRLIMCYITLMTNTGGSVV